MKGLAAFLDRVDERRGDYLIAAPYRELVEWVAGKIMASEPYPNINRGAGIVRWPSGSRGFLRSLSRSDTLDTLAGMQLDGVLLVLGEQGRLFPAGLDACLARLSAGPHFIAWEVYR